MKKIVRDNSPEEGKPALIEMDSLDADHAVAADPDRYSIEMAKPVLPPLTLEQRVARLELRLGPETPEEIEARNSRNRELQERAAEENAARDESLQPQPAGPDDAPNDPNAPEDEVK